MNALLLFTMSLVVACTAHICTRLPYVHSKLNRVTVAAAHNVIGVGLRIAHPPTPTHTTSAELLRWSAASGTQTVGDAQNVLKCTHKPQQSLSPAHPMIME
jgi:hypothetical protein